MGRGRGQAGGGTAVASRARASAATPQAVEVATLKRLQDIQQGNGIVTTSTAFHMFSPVDVEYEENPDCRETDDFGNRCHYVCRCRKITDLRVSSVDTDRIADGIIYELENEAEKQEKLFKNFRRTKVFKATPNEINAQLIAFAERRAEQRASCSELDTRVYDPVLRERLKNMTEEDRDQVRGMVESAEFNTDDFRATVESGYYGEEVDGPYFDNQPKWNSLSERIKNYFRFNPAVA